MNDSYENNGISHVKANIKGILFWCLCRHYNQGFSKECITEFFSFYFSTKMYVVGTQKNRLKETVLLSIQNIYNVLKVMGKKIFTILC